MGDIEKNGSQTASNGKNGHKPNGYQATNGHSKSAGKKYPDAPLGKSSKQKKPSKLGGFMALRQASKRPVPTEMGDGSYRAVAKRPTLKQDLSTFSLKGKWTKGLKRTTPSKFVADSMR